MNFCTHVKMDMKMQPKISKAILEPGKFRAFLELSFICRGCSLNEKSLYASRTYFPSEKSCSEMMGKIINDLQRSVREKQRTGRVDFSALDKLILVPEENESAANLI